MVTVKFLKGLCFDVPSWKCALNILGMEKVEACIFLNHLVPITVPGTCKHLTERGCLLAVLFFACSQLLGLWVLLDTFRTFLGYLLPYVNTNNKVFD
jgi:hypothetical protein